MYFAWLQANLMFVNYKRLDIKLEGLKSICFVLYCESWLVIVTLILRGPVWQYYRGQLLLYVEEEEVNLAICGVTA